VSTPDLHTSAAREGITLRAFVLGTLASLAIGTGVSYADTMIRGCRIAQDFGSPVAIFLLVLVAAGLNPLMGCLRRSWYLSSAEVALIYIMALLAAAVPSMGFTSFFVPYLSGAQYYATPENQWAELFLHHVPTWLIPHDATAIKDFYEGNPSAQIDWDAWLPPLLAWAPFMLALYLVMIALMVVMRRQWMDHERLLYPLMQPSLAMIAQDRHRMPPLFRSWLFWMGWALPFSVGIVNGLHAYHPFIPEIELYGWLLLFRETTPIRPSLSFATLGLTYFLSQDIALGIWVFNLIAKLEQGAFNVLGITSTERMEWVTVPHLAHQNLGAMIVLVMFGLWMGRGHLKAVLRKAFHGDATVDDSEEMMSYRAAVFSVLGGVLFMLWWLVETGLPLWAAGLALLVAFVIFQGLTLMVTQGGFFIARTPMNPGHFVVSGFGVDALGGRGVTALGYTWSWAGEMRIFVMAACANSLQLAHRCLRGNRRLLLWAMLVAIAVSVSGSVWMQLALGYKYGAINMGGFYTGLVKYPSNFISRHIINETPWNGAGWVWTAFGGALMWILMVARQRFVWWPIHPMSMPISAMWMTDIIMLSVFVSWLLKLVILKYGGPGLYSRGKPLFIGLVAGHFTSMCVWTVIDAFTGMTDNQVYFL
jgi:hypothetical protein